MLVTAPQQEKLDPRVKRTRNLIQQAFLELLTEKDFHSISVQDITERAEVNRATFYAHFADKFALLDESIRLSFRQELETRTLNTCRFSETNLHALIVTVCEFVAQSQINRKTSEDQFESLVETQVKKQIQELMQFWLEKIGSEIDPGMAATAASWSIYGLVLQWSREKNHPTAEDYAWQILPLIAANLRLRQETAPA
jgi:AcrR family transcriptional regulator